jgi:hypothetical protein
MLGDSMIEVTTSEATGGKKSVFDMSRVDDRKSLAAFLANLEKGTSLERTTAISGLMDESKTNAAQKQLWRKRAIGVMGLSVAFLAIIFGMMITAIDAAKETKVDGQSNQLLTTDGAPVSTTNPDMTVDGSGTLVAQSADRRLGDAAVPVKTAESLTSGVLTSVIPDEYLNNIKELTIGAKDTGFVKAQVTGVVRMKSAAAKCGSYVTLTTQTASGTGTLKLDDEEAFASGALETDLQGLGLDKLMGSIHYLAGGRRLSEALVLQALFSFIGSYDWKCESIEKPQLTWKSYRLSKESFLSCSGKSCSSKFMEGGKPGVTKGSDGTRNMKITHRILNTPARYVKVTTHPNHPGVTLVKSLDWATGFLTQYRFDGTTATECLTKQNPTTGGAVPTNTITHYLAFTGIAGQYEKFAIVEAGNEHLPHYEIWMDKDTGAPARVVSPSEGAASVPNHLIDFVGDDEAGTASEMLQYPTSCSEADSAGPAYSGPYEETRANVIFYQQKLKASGLSASEVGMRYGAYWRHWAKAADLPLEEPRDPLLDEEREVGAAIVEASEEDGGLVLPDDAPALETAEELGQYTEATFRDFKALATEAERRMRRRLAESNTPLPEGRRLASGRELGWIWRNEHWQTQIGVWCCYHQNAGTNAPQGEFNYGAAQNDLHVGIEATSTNIWYWSSGMYIPRGYHRWYLIQDVAVDIDKVLAGGGDFTIAIHSVSSWQPVRRGRSLSAERLTVTASARGVYEQRWFGADNVQVTADLSDMASSNRKQIDFGGNTAIHEYNNGNIRRLAVRHLSITDADVGQGSADGRVHNIGPCGHGDQEDQTADTLDLDASGTVATAPTCNTACGGGFFGWFCSTTCSVYDGITGGFDFDVHEAIQPHQDRLTCR